MKNVLLIDGHDYYERAKGNLTKEMCSSIYHILKGKYEIKTTVVYDGYDVPNEIEKFKWADVIIIQTPIYWFNLPGMLKKYIDDVFEPNIFFTKSESEKFGRGGLFTNKYYMLSLSWGASEKEFSKDHLNFLEGKNEDEVLFSVHKTMEYCGLKPLKTFSLYKAMRDPNLEKRLADVEKHLKDIFHI